MLYSQLIRTGYAKIWCCSCAQTNIKPNLKLAQPSFYLPSTVQEYSKEVTLQILEFANKMYTFIHSVYFLLQYFFYVYNIKGI
jgi:hypothetical protein